MNSEKYLTWQGLAHVFHHCFSVMPTTEQLDFYQQLAENWPQLDDASTSAQAQQLLVQFFNQDNSLQSKLDALALDITQLIYGPGTPNAAPWGSAYLDQAQLVNSTSTMKLKAFLGSQQLMIVQDENRPLDHICLCFSLMSYYCEQLAAVATVDTTGTVNTALTANFKRLLCDYYLPWLPRFFELMSAHAQTDFYRGLAQLGQVFLQDLQQELQLEGQVANLPLYR